MRNVRFALATCVLAMPLYSVATPVYLDCVIRHRLPALATRLRYAFGPRIGVALLSLSTFAAKRRLEKNGPLDILLDSSVLAAAVTHETRWVSNGLANWGPHRISTGYAARVPVRAKPSGSNAREVSVAERDYEASGYLVGIAHLARLGLLRLRTSGELQVEQWGKPAGMFSGYGIFDHSLFSGLEIRSVDRIPNMTMGPAWMGLPDAQQQQRARLTLSGDPLYRGIVRHLGEKHSQDAWHIRTAEVSGMFCFLTSDYALCRHLRAHGAQDPIKSLRTKVMTPNELGRYLGLRPLDPKYVSYEHASFPVRPDLNMPEGKRRRPKRKPK